MFDVYVLYRGAFWDLNSSQIARDINDIQIDFVQLFESVRGELRSHEGLVFVGMASEEGEDEQREVDLAEARANQLRTWYGGMDSVPLFTWNLGQHMKSKRKEDLGPGSTRTAQTRVQRTAMVIAIDRWTEGIDTHEKMKGALEDALTQHSSFIFARNIRQVQAQAEAKIASASKYWPGLDGYSPGPLYPVDEARGLFTQLR